MRIRPRYSPDIGKTKKKNQTETEMNYPHAKGSSAKDGSMDKVMEILA